MNILFVEANHENIGNALIDAGALFVLKKALPYAAVLNTATLNSSILRENAS